MKRAFKWHAVRPTDTADFGARLPSQTSEVKGYLLLIYCVLTFGWRGSPGEYMVFSWGVKWVHASHRPHSPAVNDIVAFASKWLMDDGVVLEPLCGRAALALHGGP